MSSNHLIVELDHQPIELCKLLKVANLVGGGGEAKIVISEGYVILNGEVEFQKRKKVYHEDVIEFNGDLVQVLVNENLTEDDTTDNNEEIADEAYNISAQETRYTTQQKKPNKKQQSKSPKGTKKPAAPLQDAVSEQDQPASTPRKRRPISF